ncbi:hypothetical protein [Viridibacterium curvum]|uniref:Uncharacterized protein n=1 Tax=Viridibacterium curvum TaxID=1101404 RepID=A0ABP9QZW9_9RHOO
MSQGHNPYAPPQSPVYEVGQEGENTSGMGKGHPIPEDVKGWGWGPFVLSWIWALGNKTYIGLLALVPYVGLIVSIYLGIKGRELAWQNKRWDSVEHFNRIQRRWSFWALVLFILIPAIGIAAAILIPLLAR